MTDIANLSRQQLAAAANRGVADELIKQAAREAASMVLQHQQVSQHVQMSKISRRKVSEVVIFNMVDEIVKVSQVAALANAGVIQLTDDDYAILQDGIGRVAKISEGLAEMAAEATETEEEMLQSLIEAAAEDPEVAAELISEQEGTEVSAEDVNEVAGDLVESTMYDEMSDEEKEAAPAAEKNSAARATARITKLSQAGLSPISQEVIVAYARNLYSQVMHEAANG